MQVIPLVRERLWGKAALVGTGQAFKFPHSSLIDLRIRKKKILTHFLLVQVPARIQDQLFVIMAGEKSVNDTASQPQLEVMNNSDEPPRTMAEAIRKLWTPKKLVIAISG